jgi:hypothetical protein
VFNSKGAFIQREGATSEGVLGRLTPSRGIPRFPSDPFERRARRIFYLVPHQIVCKVPDLASLGNVVGIWEHCEINEE